MLAIRKMPAPLVVILNPASGKGRELKAEKLAAPFRTLGREARVLTPGTGSEITTLASQAAKGAAAAVAAGGDGTVSAVAYALALTDTPDGRATGGHAEPFRA